MRDLKQPTVVEALSQYHGHGPFLDINGTPYLDIASGTFNLPLGYTHPRLTEALQGQLTRCAHLSSAFTRPISELLLARLRPYLPEGIERMWLRDVTGSGAVEGAIRMAQKATGRSGVLSLFKSHHGQSMITAQISGNAFRLAHFHASLEGSLKIPHPQSVLSAEETSTPVGECPIDLDEFIDQGSSDNIACVIVEPILGNGGNIVLSNAFFEELRALCTRRGIVLIADEVQTGFGRTGSFFASSGFAQALKPDMVVFAKGAGGIGIPTAGVLMKPEFDVLESFEHSSTAGANPLSLVAMESVIDVIEDESLLVHVQQHEKILRSGLLELQQRYAWVSGVRGVGFMYGFDVPSAAIANHIVEQAMAHGLIVRSSRYGRGNTVKVRPPLVCTAEHFQMIFERLDATLADINHSVAA